MVEILFFVLCAVVLLRLRKVRREAATRAELAELTRHLREVERSLERLESAVARAAAREPPSVAAPAPPAAAVAPPPQEPAVKPREIREARTAPAAAPPSAPVPIPSFLPQREVSKAQPRRWADLEEQLGANWLNKIGTAAFVIGVALLLNYSMHYFGPKGKITLAYLLAAVLVVLGVIGERRDRYRIAARAVLGGGWAIVYFTTYAVHNVPAVRLVESPTLGFLLLFVVAAAMVAHSLRYNSELATGFAYLLGFASVAVSHMTLGTLVASAALVASLAVVLWRRRWYAVEPVAIAASYAVHWLWLRQIFAALGGHKPFPQFKASAALLTIYWLAWATSYFLREEREPTERRWLTASFLLNAGGYLAVLHYQSLYPQLRFWFLLPAGAVYLALSVLAQRVKRRQAFVLTTTMGAALVVAAIPLPLFGDAPRAAVAGGSGGISGGGLAAGRGAPAQAGLGRVGCSDGVRAVPGSFAASCAVAPAGPRHGLDAVCALGRVLPQRTAGAAPAARRGYGNGHSRVDFLVRRGHGLPAGRGVAGFALHVGGARLGRRGRRAQ